MAVSREETYDLIGILAPELDERTLVSLTHLVCWNDEDAGLVQLYARQLEERLLGLEALLRSADPNVREARARLCN